MAYRNLTRVPNRIEGTRFTPDMLHKVTCLRTKTLITSWEDPPLRDRFQSIPKMDGYPTKTTVTVRARALFPRIIGPDGQEIKHQFGSISVVESFKTFDFMGVLDEKDNQKNKETLSRAYGELLKQEFSNTWSTSIWIDKFPPNSKFQQRLSVDVTVISEAPNPL